MGWCEGWVGGWVDRKGVYGDLGLDGDGCTMSLQSSEKGLWVRLRMSCFALLVYLILPRYGNA